MQKPMKFASVSCLCSCLLFAPALAYAEDKYAIVIGVETYDTSTFDNLDYAAEDAAELGKSLERLGFQVTVMSSESRSSRLRPTTPKKIAAAIESALASCANGDTLLISLSGHGVQFSDEDLLPSGVRETYFCPGDADIADKASLLKISSVVNLMNSAAASRKLLLVDACQEQVLSAEGQKKSARRIELGSVHENRRSVPGGMAVLFSCSSGQFSWEHDAIGHSVFTYHVIEYLSGRAENRFYESERADLNGLVYYVAKRTNDYVISKNLSSDGQLPVMRGSSANWPLGNLDVSDEISNSLGMKLVLVSAGDFRMGSRESKYQVAIAFSEDPDTFANEHPLRRVNIARDFYIGATEVTHDQFRSFVNATGYRTQAESGTLGEAATSVGLDRNSNWRRPDGNLPLPKHPVVMVTYNDAVAFCNWLSRKESRVYRLPTDEEWEYAARAGSETRFWNGNDPRKLTEIANVPDRTLSNGSQEDSYRSSAQIGKTWVDTLDGFAGLAPVGSFPANPWGLHDVHGNVWEWCSVVKPATLKITDTRNIAVIRGGCLF